MGWATGLIADLKEGKTVCFRPRGNSMVGIIQSGDLCTVEPVSAPLQKGDVVLCSVRGAQYLHLISGLRANQAQISNNRGHVNGWTPLSSVYGKLIRVER